MYSGPNSLQGKVLISQPTTNSPFFNESVILVCEHHAKGAWGLVVNKQHPSLDLKTVSQGIDCGIYANEHVFQGGPVAQDGLHFIHTPDCTVGDTFSVTPGLCVTSSEAMLREIGENRGPSNWRLCVGVSTWQAGQLEGEINSKCWMTAEPSKELLLNTPVEQIYEKAIKICSQQIFDKYI